MAAKEKGRYQMGIIIFVQKLIKIPNKFFSTQDSKITVRCAQKIHVASLHITQAFLHSRFLHNIFG